MTKPALLDLGTPDEVEDCVAHLIAGVGGEGSFILNTGTVVDEARPG